MMMRKVQMKRKTTASGGEDHRPGKGDKRKMKRKIWQCRELFLLL